MLPRGKSDAGLDNLKRKYGTEETVTADILGEIKDINGLYQLGVSDVKYQENKITIRYDTKNINSSTVVGWLMDKADTKDVNIIGTRIEDVIRRMYQMQN